MDHVFSRVLAVILSIALLVSTSGSSLCVKASDTGVSNPGDGFDGVIDADDLFGGGSDPEPDDSQVTADGLWKCIISDKGAELTAYLGTDVDVRVPETVTVEGNAYDVWKLGENVFANCPNVTIWCYKNSAAHTYAVANGIAYRFIIPELAFAGASLSLQHNLSVNYKVDKALFADDAYSEPYVIFTLNGKETKVSKYSVDGDRYVFTFRNIAPNQMNDTIYATLYATYEGELYNSATREYSVAQYCYNMLGKYPGDSYAKLRTLLVDLLNYGTQSQLYTSYNTTALVNGNLTDTQKAWGTNTAPALNSVKNIAYETVENPKATWKSGGLKLEEAVTLRFKLAADSVEGLSVKIRTGSREWEIDSSAFVETDGGYYVYFNGLHAGQMRESVYLTVYEGNTPVSNTACYSIESYAYEKQTSTTGNLAALVKAMMCYGDSASAYESK